MGTTVTPGTAGSTPTMRSLLLLTALTLFFVASSFVLTSGEYTSQHALDEPRALHCISRNAVRSLQFCLCLNYLDLGFFETLECECHLSNETVSCRYTDSEINGVLVAWVIFAGLIALVFLVLVLAGLAIGVHQLWKKRGLTVQLGLPRQTSAFQTMKDEDDPDGPPG